MPLAAKLTRYGNSRKCKTTFSQSSIVLITIKHPARTMEHQIFVFSMLSLLRTLGPGVTSRTAIINRRQNPLDAAKNTLPADRRFPHNILFLFTFLYAANSEY